MGGSLVSAQANKYDAFGYRSMKLTNNGNVAFDYDVLSGNLLDETKWGGTSFSHSYVYLEGEPLARINYDVDSDPNQTPWPIHYYHNDRLGTPQKTTDRTGNVSWAAGFDPFGKATPTTAFITQNLRFPGQYYDEETGLHYNIARFYDPNLGRYLQSDPIGLMGVLINTYTYVRNNPVNLIDPEGLEDSGLIQICAANGQRSNCTTGMRAPPDGSPMNGPLSPVGQAATFAEAGMAFIPGIKPATSFPKCPSIGKTAADFPAVASQISQKQLRHIAGRAELAERGGGGYMNSVADAQAVLDAYRNGSANIVGTTSQGFPIVQVEGVVGTNVNVGAGIAGQATNVFIIKGTTRPSVVPTTPN